ncbi:hypothetical protein HK096_009399, partial [Nowakowskiella sp. JEL0078]
MLDRVHTDFIDYDEQYTSHSTDQIDQTLQFQNMVTRNDDETMVEARALLHQWINSTNSLADDASSDLQHSFQNDLAIGDHRSENRIDRNTTHKNKNFISDEEKQSIMIANIRDTTSKRNLREMLVNIVGSGIKMTKSLNRDISGPAVQDPRIVMAARQQLARERREKKELERRNEIERRLSEKRNRIEEDIARCASLKESLKNEIEERINQERVLHFVKIEIESDLEIKKQKALANRLTFVEEIKQEIA